MSHYMILHFAKTILLPWNHKSLYTHTLHRINYPKKIILYFIFQFNKFDFMPLKFKLIF